MTAYSTYITEVSTAVYRAVPGGAREGISESLSLFIFIFHPFIYRVAARQPAQNLELLHVVVLGIGSDDHFDASGSFWGTLLETLRENWPDTVATLAS
jgi:hypothetical protein